MSDITIKLTSLKLINNDQHTNAIAEAYVEVEISDESKTTKHMVIGKFDTANIPNFTDLSNITNEQIIDWVSSQFNGQDKLLEGLQKVHDNAPSDQTTITSAPGINGFKFGKISV